MVKVEIGEELHILCILWLLYVKFADKFQTLYISSARKEWSRKRALTGARIATDRGILLSECVYLGPEIQFWAKIADETNNLQI